MRVSEIKELNKVVSRMYKVEKNRPGLFAGWIDETHRIAWVVSPHREDRRTGAKCHTPMSDYAKELYSRISFGFPIRAAKNIDVEALVEKDPKPRLFTLQYREKVGIYAFDTYYALEAEDEDAAWSKAITYMRARKVPINTMCEAVLFDGDKKIPFPESER